MAKNMVQFQKGISISEFIDQYGAEEQCRKALVKFKWPKGFYCAYCGNPTYCEIRHRKIYQCNRCHHQTSIIAGTIFHKTHLPFTKWFLAIYLITQNKNGISAMALSRQIGVSYNAAYRLKQKLMQVMLERGSGKKLHCRVEIDDSYLGGKRIPGKRGRGAGKKVPFLAAIETDMDKHPLKIKLSMVNGFRKEEIERWGKHHLEAGTLVASDGLNCFNGLEDADVIHEPHVMGSGKAAVLHPSFKWVNIILGNLKNALRGTYHGFKKKHAPRYLSEFQYRFNRRYDLPAMIPRFLYIALRTPPMPSHLLSLAEIKW